MRFLLIFSILFYYNLMTAENNNEVNILVGNIVKGKNLKECSVSNNIPVVKLACSIVEYKKSKDIKAFLNQLSSKSELLYLWKYIPDLKTTLGEIATPLLLKELDTNYSNEIIEKVLDIANSSDGEHAGGLSEILVNTFISHPNLFINNWNNIKEKKGFEIFKNGYCNAFFDQKTLEIKMIYTKHLEIISYLKEIEEKHCYNMVKEAIFYSVSSYEEKYGPWNIMDLEKNTAWCFEGKQAHLQINFDDESKNNKSLYSDLYNEFSPKSMKIGSLQIINGNSRNKKEFNLFNRVKVLTVKAILVDNEVFEKKITLVDNNIGFQESFFTTDKKVRIIHLTINDVFPGKKNVTCISEIKFMSK